MARTLNNLRDPYKAPKKDHGDGNAINILFGNITSGGPKAESFIFSDSVFSKYQVLMFAEVHLRDVKLSNLQQKLTRANWACNGSFTPAEVGNSESGTSGGELVAIKNNFDSIPVDERVLKQIESETSETIRFAARILRCRGFSCVLVSLYLKCSVGLNETNNTRLKQVHILSKILGLPFICLGDFNVCKEELIKSGWPQFLKCEVVLPSDATTTLRNTTGRVIDYMLISLPIISLIDTFVVDDAILTTPHFSLHLTIHARPRCLYEPVLCTPAVLPVEDFKAEWKKLPGEQRDMILAEAYATARYRLHGQKLKTGIGILGKPLLQMISTERISEAIFAGELFAEASLASELVVLLATKISRDDWHKYIGRGQFPKIMNKPIVPKNKKGNYSREDLEQWAAFFTKIDFFLSLENGEKRTLLGEEIQSILPKIIRLFPENLRLSEFSKFSLSSYGVTSFLQLSTEQILVIKDSTSIAFDLTLKDVIYKASSDWRSFVKQQLHKGGGLLFKHISKEDKAFLNVDLGKICPGTSSPSEAIATQTEFWSQYWAPPREDLIQKVSIEMSQLRQLGFEYTKNYNYTAEDFLEGLIGYSRESRGVDMWKSSEFKVLPVECIHLHAAAIQTSVRVLSWPIQINISLQALLGKVKGVRTITLTSLVYSIWNRSQKQVKMWENHFSGDYDTCRPGSSALLAALGRAARAEIGFWLGKFVASILHDYVKFFASMNIAILIKEAKAVNYTIILH